MRFISQTIKFSMGMLGQATINTFCHSATFCQHNDQFSTQ